MDINQDSGVAARVKRGMALADAGAVKQYGPDTFVVRGTSRNYTVHLEGVDGAGCDCPDTRSREREVSCKHIYAATIFAAKCRRATTARPKVIRH